MWNRVLDRSGAMMLNKPPRPGIQKEIIMKHRFIPHTHWSHALIMLILCITSVSGDTVLFQDAFKGKLGEGWSWVRERKETWRLTPEGLEIKVEPGNMWGSANNARNILKRPLPALKQGELEITALLENKPSHQYEQIDLVWYHDDAHMVKIGIEQVDGVLSMVMGREEKDRTRTLAIIPIQSTTLEVRFNLRGSTIKGWFREKGQGDWRLAGECELPPVKPAFITLQAYQGPPDQDHWARITRFRIVQKGS